MNLFIHALHQKDKLPLRTKFLSIIRLQIVSPEHSTSTKHYVNLEFLKMFDRKLSFSFLQGKNLIKVNFAELNSSAHEAPLEGQTAYLVASQVALVEIFARFFCLYFYIPGLKIKNNF